MTGGFFRPHMRILNILFHEVTATTLVSLRVLCQLQVSLVLCMKIITKFNDILCDFVIIGINCNQIYVSQVFKFVHSFSETFCRLTRLYQTTRGTAETLPLFTLKVTTVHVQFPTLSKKLDFFPSAWPNYSIWITNDSPQ